MLAGNMNKMAKKKLCSITDSDIIIQAPLQLFFWRISNFWLAVKEIQKIKKER